MRLIFVAIGSSRFRMIAYAACLEGSDPVLLFEKRMNMRRGNISEKSAWWITLNRTIYMISGVSLSGNYCTRSEPGYEFDKASLLEYNHMSFGGPPVTTDTVEEADELMQNDEKESAIGKWRVFFAFFSELWFSHY